MTPQVRQFADQARFGRESVKQMAEMLPADDVELDNCIAEAVRESHQMGFMLMVLAALSKDRPVDARHLASGAKLIPGAGYMVAIVLRVHGEMPEYLLEGLRNSVMNAQTHGAALFCIAVWCDEHRNGVYPDEMISQARSMMRRFKPDTEQMAFFLALAVHAKDAALNALIRHHYPGPEDKWKIVEQSALSDIRKAVAGFRGPVLEVIPAEMVDTLQIGRTVRRAVPRLGRNEPCHCGSGKKYKNCHYAEDQKRLHESSDVAGVTQTQLHAKLEPHMTHARMDTIGPADIARLDPKQISRTLLPEYFYHLAAYNLLDRAIDALELVGYTDDLEKAWGTILWVAIKAGRKDIAERLLKVRGPSGPAPEDLGLSVMLLLAQDDPAKSIELIEEVAKGMLDSEDDAELTGLGDSVMYSKFPALGLFLYRGVLPLISPEKAAECYQQMLFMRDRLNVPPDDPIGEVIDTGLIKRRDDGKDAAALRDAQEKYETKRREVRALKESLDQLEKELARRERASTTAAAPRPGVDKDVLKELRQKVSNLQSTLKDRGDERNALRRQLQKATNDLEQLRQRAPAAPSEDSEADSEEDLLLPQDTDSNQPFRTIEFPRNFQQRLNEFPRQVARSAMAMLGRLAGGDPAAFVGAVRLKAAPTVMRQRIGIDFRLLFRLLPDRIQVVDLIPRQDLERRIKTLG